MQHVHRGHQSGSVHVRLESPTVTLQFTQVNDRLLVLSWPPMLHSHLPSTQQAYKSIQ